MNKLFIIGNGFDLYHGIKSGYWNFKEYVEEVDPTIFNRLDKYFEPDNLWSDFERTLAYLNTDDLLDDASNFLMSYSDENWRDSGHHDYEYEISQAINAVTVDLKKHFTEWVLQIEIVHAARTSRLLLPRDARYITFNYTATLETLYGVPVTQIKYIHNKAIDSNSILILGHGRDPSTIPSMNEMNEEEIADQDVRVSAGNQIIDEYFTTTYKNTDTIIAENHAFFESLSSVDEVSVIGHSMSDVDLKYFAAIIRHIDVGRVKWKVSYHRVGQVLERKRILNDLGVSDDLIIFYSIEQFGQDPHQLSLM